MSLSHAGDGSCSSSDLESHLPAFLRRGDLIIIFALAVFLRLTLFAASNNQATTDGVLAQCFDCRQYLYMAQDIAHGTPDAEHGFFYFGPGYGVFLAAMNIFALGKPGILILVNIILSSLSCLLLYKLAMKLTQSYAISIIAALLAVVSYTSIGLSLLVMSDTLYFFILLLMLLAFLKALETGRISLFILAGLLGGASVLTRSLGQLWPLLMVLIAVAFLWKRRDIPYVNHSAAWKIAGKTAISAGLVFAMTLAWVIRNDIVHDTPVVAFTSANGPANLAAITIERLTGTPSNEVLAGWTQDYIDATGDSDISLGELLHLRWRRAVGTFDTLGWDMVKTYVSLDWENLNEISYLHRTLVPKYNNTTIPMEIWIMGHGLNYVNFILSMLGLIILFATGRVRTAVILGIIYFYYALLLGAYRWQYSRHFLPGQIAWAILIAVTIVFAGRHLIRAVKYILRMISLEFSLPARR